MSLHALCRINIKIFIIYYNSSSWKSCFCFFFLIMSPHLASSPSSHTSTDPSSHQTLTHPWNLFPSQRKRAEIQWEPFVHPQAASYSLSLGGSAAWTPHADWLTSGPPLTSPGHKEVYMHLRCNSQRKKEVLDHPYPLSCHHLRPVRWSIKSRLTWEERKQPINVSLLVFHSEMKTQQTLHVATPVRQSLALTKVAGTSVYLKLDSSQPTGSFKIRGIGHLCRTVSNLVLFGSGMMLAGLGLVSVVLLGWSADILQHSFL